MEEVALLMDFNCDHENCGAKFNNEMDLVQHYLFEHGKLRPMCGSKIETKLAKLVEEITFLRGTKKYIICTHPDRRTSHWDVDGHSSDWLIYQSKLIIGLINELKKEILDFESIPVYRKIEYYICDEHEQVGISSDEVEKQITNSFKMTNEWDRDTVKLVKYAKRIKKQLERKNANN